MLVVAPLRVIYNVWPKQKDEWEEFKDLKVVTLHGPSKEAALLEKADIYCINPEGLEWLLNPTYETKTDSNGRVVVNKKKIVKVDNRIFDLCNVLLVDESTKFKEYSTNRFALLRFVIPKFKRRYILTGTIAPNGLLDLFGQIFILDQGASLGRYITHYRDKWFHQVGYGGYQWDPDVGAKESIAKAIAPLVLQVDIKDYVKMPKLLPPHDIYVDLPPVVMKQYRTMEKKMIAEVLAGNIVAKNAAVASGKCRQIANGALYTSPSGEYEILHGEKLDALEDLLEQLQGQPVLIAYVFDFDRELIS